MVIVSNWISSVAYPFVRQLDAAAWLVWQLAGLCDLMSYLTPKIQSSIKGQWTQAERTSLLILHLKIDFSWQLKLER